MPVNYKEDWVVKINKEAFVLDERQMPILREAMKRNDRWVYFKDMILSVPHIECIYLNHREIADQLSEGDTEELHKPISKEKLESIRKEVYNKIGRKTG